MEDGLEVLDGGDGDLVGGVHGDALAEVGEDVLQLLVGLRGLREGRVKQLPRLRHAQHLHTHTHTEREGGKEEG